MPHYEQERKIIIRQLKVRLRELEETIYHDRQPIGTIEACVTGQGKGPEEPPRKGWKPFQVYQRWGGFDQTTWFRMTVVTPESMKGKRMVAFIRPGGESLVRVNGKPFQGLDRNRDELYLTESAKPGEKFDIILESVPSVRFDEYHYFEYADIAQMEPLVWDFWWDCKVLLDVIEHIQENYAPRRQLLDTLDRAVKSVDFQHKGESAYFRSIARAQRTLRRELKKFAHSYGMGTLILTGQSHIDSAWLWPLRETRRKCSRTFSTVLNLMDRYPDFPFLCSQPVQYEWIEKHYPELFERIKKRVQEGRWEAFGGMYVESDCNIPSGESFVRQFLYGNRYFRKAFGVHSRTAWLPDTFGDSWALPQILKKAQIDMFVTTKISWNEYTKFPYSFFQWEGVDGTRVPCLMPPLNYNGYVRLPDIIEQWEGFHQKEKVDELPFPFGFGDGGGGPTMEMIETGRRLKNIVGVPRCEFGRMQDCLDRMLEKTKDTELPVWNGELYLELHRGCLTTQARTKRFNRKGELALRDAEMLSSISLLFGGQYDSEKFTKLWKGILLNQFHDILPGSSIREVYATAEKDYAEILKETTSLRDQAIDTLARQIDTEGEGIPLLIINTAPWVRDALITWEGKLPRTPFHVQAPDGEAIPVQRTGKKKIIFQAKNLPPLGYAVYRLVPGPLEISSSLKISQRLLENEYLRVRFDRKGLITSIMDKQNNRELIPEGKKANILQLYDDRPKANDAWDIDFNFEENTWEPNPPESITIEEEGPIRATLRIVRKTEKSTITQDVSLTATGRRIDFKTHVDWHEKRVLMKAAFPVTIHSSRATYEIQYGAIERPTHRNTPWDQAKFEVAAHRWADLSEGDYGVSLLNDCKYGYDIKGNVMRISLLRSPVEPDPHADEGEHHFTYSVYPHAWDWRNGTVQEAYELNIPPIITQVPVQQGTLPATYAFATVDLENIIIDTIKRCEDSDAIILRLYEAYGQRGEVTLTFERTPKQVEECDLMEENGRAVKTNGNNIKFFVTPFEIRTFKIMF